MPSDFGDESGEKLFDWMLDIGQEAGQQAMESAASKLTTAFKNVKGGVGKETFEKNEDAVQWAKLDMSEFQQIEQYETIKDIINAKLAANDIKHEFVTEEGKDSLVFRVDDAPAVNKSFDELIEQTKQAEQKVKDARAQFRDKARSRDEQPLDERSQQAKAASEAHNQTRTGVRARMRDLVNHEAKSK